MIMINAVLLCIYTIQKQFMHNNFFIYTYRTKTNIIEYSSYLCSLMETSDVASKGVTSSLISSRSCSREDNSPETSSHLSSSSSYRRQRVSKILQTQQTHTLHFSCLYRAYLLVCKCNLQLQS